jgi:DNA-directed RNA polymerase specialized sigma24 family protein
MSGYTEKDAAKDTDVPIREVRQAWHDAREDARKDKERRDKESDVGYTRDWKKR